jgi:hypothetical protein
MTEEECSGTDPEFPPIKKLDISLPVLFDATCPKCKKPDRPMEHMDTVVCGRHRPFATFQCPLCMHRLFLVHMDGEKTPLFIGSNEFGGACVDFSDFVDTKIRTHKDKRIRRDVREKGYSTPSEMDELLVEQQLSLPLI